MTNIPVYIPAFNNPTYVTSMIMRLNELGLLDIIVVDNDSTYVNMARCLAVIFGTSSIIQRHANLGPFIWKDTPLWNTLPEVFIITDPDLELNPALPLDFIEQLLRLTNEFKIGKAGFALDISEPSKMRDELFDLDGKQHIWEWEKQFWSQQITDVSGNPVYRAIIDTTFAVYNKRYFLMDNPTLALRVAGNYTAKHLPWYKETIVPREEAEYYAKTATTSYYGTGAIHVTV